VNNTYLIAVMIGAVAGVLAAALTWGAVYKKRGEAQVEEAHGHDSVVSDPDEQL